MSAKVYVGNLPQQLTRNELINHFVGIEMLKIDLGVDREGRFNGYCYLTVTDEATADMACDEYNRSELSGRCLRVAKSLQRHHHCEVSKHEFDLDLAMA